MAAALPSRAVRRVSATCLTVVAVAVAGCGSGSGKSSTSSAPSGGAPAQTQTQAASGATGCRQVQQPAPRKPPKEHKPATQLDPSKKWTLEVKTSCGNFTIALDPKTAPKNSASMVALAKAGFFKNTVFHRIAVGFVIQGGDPTATGQGGPGYTVVDKPPKSAKYTRGVVAMAKTQTEPGGSGGSQFFVVTGADAGLPPQYAVIGRVTKG